jgi:hypothetical protein
VRQRLEGDAAPQTVLTGEREAVRLGQVLGRLRHGRRLPKGSSTADSGTGAWKSAEDRLTLVVFCDTCTSGRLAPPQTARRRMRAPAARTIHLEDHMPHAFPIPSFDPAVDAGQRHARVRAAIGTR